MKQEFSAEYLMHEMQYTKEELKTFQETLKAFDEARAAVLAKREEFFTMWNRNR